MLATAGIILRTRNVAPSHKQGTSASRVFYGWLVSRACKDTLRPILETLTRRRLALSILLSISFDCRALGRCEELDNKAAAVQKVAKSKGTPPTRKGRQFGHFVAQVATEVALTLNTLLSESPTSRSSPWTSRYRGSAIGQN
eukprot:5011824-Pleurochrysis_carterae.AAC.6